MKLFILGIDGLTYTIIDPLIEAGHLPNFSRLKREGGWRILKSTVPPITPAAWMSLSTGLKPAKHGVIDFWDVDWQAETIKLKLVTRRKRDRAIWDILSEYGWSVAVLNVPCTYPPDAVNGVMISGFSAPGLDSAFVYPPEFKNTLLQHIPDYEIDIAQTEQSKELSGEEILDLVNTMTDKREMLLDLMLERTWDFIFFTLVGPDRLQHVIWDEMEHGSARVTAYFQRLDAILGKIMTWLGEDGMLVVVSDHGFSRATNVCRINQFLSEFGQTKLRESVSLRNTLITVAEKLKIKNLLERFYHVVMPAKAEIASATDRLLGSIRFEQSKMWAMAHEMSSYAMLFCPEGASISPEELAQIVGALQAQGIVSSDGAFTGSALSSELGGSNERENLLAVLLANKSWTFQGRARPGAAIATTANIGVHHMDGCLMMWGRGVKHARFPERASVIDVVPSILYALDIPLEASFDGRPLTEMFSYTRPARFKDSLTGVVWIEGQDSDKAQRKIERLLGEMNQ